MTDRPPAADPADTSGGYGPPPPATAPPAVPPATVPPATPPATFPPATAPPAAPPATFPPATAPPAAPPATFPPATAQPAVLPATDPPPPATGPYAAGAARPAPPDGSGPDPSGPAAAPHEPYGIGAYPALGGQLGYGPPRPRVRLWPPTRPEWTAALAVVAVLTVVGALLAPLWEQLAPRLEFRVDQPGRALPVVPAAEEYVAADGRFVLLTLAVGVVAGLACWLLRSARGPLLLLALAAGGLLGAVVTWRLGLRLGSGYRPEDLAVVGRTVYQPLTLRAEAALVVEPIAAVVGYLLAVGFSARNDLGRDDDPPVSSGSA